METLKVIIKMERRPTGIEPILFFPESSTRQPNIECWTWQDEHNEAAMGYFWSLKNPRPEHEPQVEAQIRNYEQQYQVRLTRIKRDSQQMRCGRWVR